MCNRKDCPLSHLQSPTIFTLFFFYSFSFHSLHFSLSHSLYPSLSIHHYLSLSLLSLSVSHTLSPAHQVSSSGAPAKSSMFSSIFRRQSIVHAPTVEGEYSDTRHVGQLKVLLEQLINGDLPTDRYPPMGIPAAIVKDGKSTVKSVRKVGANSR